jgi:hypothetical protein
MAHMKHFVLAAGVLFGSMAVASPKQISMPVGHTTTVSMPSSVTKVKVDDGSLLEVKREGHKVVMVGRAKGTTDVTVTTVDGETTLHVYVASDRFGLP